MTAQLDTATRGWKAGDGQTAAGTARRRIGMSVIWLAAIALALIVSTLLALSSLNADANTFLHPANAGEDGTMALAEVLRDEGVDVRAVNDLDEAEDAAADSATTLAIVDDQSVLSSRSAERLAALGEESGSGLVLVQPDLRTLLAMDLPLVPRGQWGAASSWDEDLLGTGSPEIEPRCESPAAQRAGSVSDGGIAYSATEDGVVLCYRPQAADGETLGAYAEIGGTRAVTVFGNPWLLSNGWVDEHGNASLALNALSAQDDLVLYFPEAGDQLGAESGSAGVESVIPSWFGAIMLWSTVVVLVLILWRGRRFGPLAMETLPVVVRAAETVEGRAALYRRSEAYDTALAGLRAAAIIRIARKLRLDSSVPAEEVARAAARALGRPEREVADVLVHARPTGERAFTQLAQSIAEIESEVHAS